MERLLRLRGAERDDLLLGVESSWQLLVLARLLMKLIEELQIIVLEHRTVLVAQVEAVLLITHNHAVSDFHWALPEVLYVNAIL